MTADTGSIGIPQKPPGEDPFQAKKEAEALKELYTKEMLEFDKIAIANAGAALMFFALVLSNTVLSYQGGEMNIESSLMDTISLLNNDLNHINSDITNIFQDIKNKDTNKEGADIEKFVKDTDQYYIDLNYYFNTGGGGKEAPFKNADFVKEISGDFDPFQVNNGQKTESLFAAFADPNTDWTKVSSSLKTLFENAYQGSTQNSSGSDPSDGSSSSMKQIDDVVSNAETQQNQINSTASTNLSADQQNFNSYEGTMKNVLSMITGLITHVNSRMGTQ
ncbi:hypothetical protein [Simkania negevensis]|uniref:Uncharacterized protein n=1 Tax=Simkania negevensis (strain ATCC VR-1471 / DSM 27360 / Z) TaxID=331113 RepID=F8L924_SIMNZ|nr:hypothetical protein [Simkania negevensis]CCB89338.1 unknown protein [Simkania negevensis Z]